LSIPGAPFIDKIRVKAIANKGLNYSIF
jgi:hypothetical protein